MVKASSQARDDVDPHASPSSGEVPPHADDYGVVAPRVVRRGRVRSHNTTRVRRVIHDDWCIALRCPLFTIHEHTHTHTNAHTHTRTLHYIMCL